jgi:hypothetical protein
MDSGSGKASGLTGRAPVSGAVVITLASRADSAAAAGTRATAFPVDPSGPTAGFDPACHLVSGNPEYPVDLSTLKGPNSPPWVNACLEARLGLEDVSDAGHQPLVQQGLAKLDRAHGSNIGARPCDLFRTAKDVRSESGQTGIPRQLDRSDQSQSRATELDHFQIAEIDHKPGRPARTAPPLTWPVYVPPAVHAHMGVKDEFRREVEKQVLPPGFGAGKPVADQSAGGSDQRTARIRSLGPEYLPLTESRLDPTGHPDNRVALSHSPAQSTRDHHLAWLAAEAGRQQQGLEVGPDQWLTVKALDLQRRNPALLRHFDEGNKKAGEFGAFEPRHQSEKPLAPLFEKEQWCPGAHQQEGTRGP